MMKRKQETSSNIDINQPALIEPPEFRDKPTAKDEVKLLTYNIFIRPPGINNNGEDFKSERLEVFMELIHDFDIICLQEMFEVGSYRKSHLINKALKVGYHFTASAPLPKFFDPYFIDGGITILSRFPIIETEFQPFPYGVMADCLALKGMLYCKISIPNTEDIHLFTTHTQATYMNLPPKEMRSTYMTRIHQLFVCREFVERMLKKHMRSFRELVLMVGDFNVDANEKTTLSSIFGEDLEYIAKRFNVDPALFKQKEYELVYDILSNNKRDKLYDLGKVANHGRFPVTFGESKTVNGVEVPCETKLTYPTDVGTNQCLDYMWQLIPVHSMTPSKAPQRPGKGTTTNPDDQYFIFEEDEEEEEEKNPGVQSNKPGQKEDIENKFAQEDRDFEFYGFDHTSLRINKFEVSNQEFTHLSDHYGIELTIRKQFLDKTSPRLNYPKRLLATFPADVPHVA